MEVRLVPNTRRPGVGLPPRRESQRPLLPHHARMCPVLEAGSDVGLLVYPPLEKNEGYRIDFEGDGQYSFTYFTGSIGGDWSPIFTLRFALPVGGVGSMREDVEVHVPNPEIDRETARDMARVFISPEDCGTPTGGVALKGATNFQTPTGWDTVYSSVFNNIERPVAPMLIVRVQTDWYAHDTEFRYVLQAGEAIHASHALPLGQVFFVPREEVTLRDCTPEELEAFKQSKRDFHRDKAAVTMTTPYGLQYSPHYARRSRSG
ncbi:MAG TPA: hypothetical protein VMO26_24010 [Vicinamibacterales bacterium]|nr:hypothetical protein [Vicinamibacterales bacterium]